MVRPNHSGWDSAGRYTPHQIQFSGAPCKCGVESALLRLDYNLIRHIHSQQWHWGSSPSTGCLQTVPRGSQRDSLDHGFCFPFLHISQGSRGQDGRAVLETRDRQRPWVSVIIPLDVETVSEDARGWPRDVECHQTHRPEDPAVNRAAVVPAAGEPTGQADGKDGQMGNTEKAESFLPYEKS